MKSAEDFIQDYFSARDDEIRRELEFRAAFRSAFFTADCLWDSRDGALERSESETIIEVHNLGPESHIITQQKPPFPKLRYILTRFGDSWLIQRVDMFVKDQGWVTQNEIKRRLKTK